MVKAPWFQVIPDFGCFSAVKLALSISLLDPSVECCGVLVDDSRVTEGCVQIRRCAEPCREGGQEPLCAWSSSGGRNSMCPSHKTLCSGLVSALQVTSCSYQCPVALPWEGHPLAPCGTVQGKLFLHPGRVGRVNFEPGPQVTFYMPWVGRQCFLKHDSFETPEAKANVLSERQPFLAPALFVATVFPSHWISVAWHLA